MKVANSWLVTEGHRPQIDDTLLNLIAPRSVFHCSRVGSVDNRRGGAGRRGGGRRGRTLVRRERVADTFLKTGLAQERAELLGRNQEAGGWIARPGHRAYEVTPRTGEDLLKDQPPT